MTAAGTRAATGTRGGPGLALGVLSAATFGISGVFATSLINAGWSPAAAVTARVGAAALVLTVPALLQLRGRWALLRRRAGRVAAFGLVAVAGCQLFYFNAIQRMPVGVALLLEYLGTVLVVGWLWLRHGQRPRRLTVAGRGRRDDRAGAGPQSERIGPARPDRGHVGTAGGRRPGNLLPALVRDRRGATAADRHGLGQHVRGRGRCSAHSDRSECYP